MVKKFGELKVGDMFMMTEDWLTADEYSRESVWVKLEPTYPLPRSPEVMYNSLHYRSPNKYGPSATRFEDDFEVNHITEDHPLWVVASVEDRYG